MRANLGGGAVVNLTSQGFQAFPEFMHSLPLHSARIHRPRDAFTRKTICDPTDLRKGCRSAPREAATPSATSCQNFSEDTPVLRIEFP